MALKTFAAVLCCLFVQSCEGLRVASVRTNAARIGTQHSTTPFSAGSFYTQRQRFLQLTPLSSTYFDTDSFYGSETEKHPAVFEKPGKGLLRDLKRKLKHYPSDFKDGFNIKALSSIFFMFFACIAPAIAFGGVLSAVTGGTMGTMETVSATAIGGILYALFSAQPITIIGTTGPLLAFLKVLYTACVQQNVPFLPIYAWVGLWSSFYLFLSSIFSVSNIVEYLTRFTDDIFSMLISVIFIFEACRDILAGFTNPAVTGLQAAVSLIVALTTFNVATTLSKLRKTSLFPRGVRNLLSDFAPTLGVACGAGAAWSAHNLYNLALPKLAVPAAFATTTGRPWLVNLMAVPMATRLWCAVPALMAYVLLFMDQNITVRLVMHQEHKLKKGSGLHLDMLVVAAVTAITSLLGMPWMVAATVRSLAHMNSLHKYAGENEKNDASNDFYSDASSSSSNGGGGVKGEIVGTVEQRLTGLSIHMLIGLSLLNYRHLLRKIPQAVLTGLFLYLGASSIGSTDLFARCKTIISDPRDLPRSNLLQRVSLQKVKLFTGIQLGLLAGMWWLKETKIGVFFPVMIGLLGPVRMLMEKRGWFTREELSELDESI